MNLTQKSKFLSLILRHKPEEIGLVLDWQGWANVGELCEKSNISTSELVAIVETDNKKRYSFNADGTKIRANQGHSLKTVDLGLQEREPPDVLHHGTSDRFLESIGKLGLTKQSRQHVHLSKDETTAKMVGKRHGNPVVLTVNTKQMHADGFKFYLSENGVWLTDHVPVEYLKGITSTL